jgi:hypothetical protein
MKQRRILATLVISVFMTCLSSTCYAVAKPSKKKVTLTQKAAIVKVVKDKAAAAAKAAKAADRAVLLDAEKSVSNAEDLSNTDNYDLVGNKSDLANAQIAIKDALVAIGKLDKNSSDYKGLMARVDTSNFNVVKALDDIDAAATQVKAAADKATADKAAADKAAADKAAAVEKLKLNTPYPTKGGLTVILNSINKIEDVGSIRYDITYTLKNDTIDQKLD